MKNKFIVITGCSGGGKSTLIAALSQMGYTTMPEAGRIIVKEQMDSGGNYLPSIDPMGFCNLLIEKSVEFYKNATQIKNTKNNVIFFDRSLIDAISYYHAYSITNKNRYDELLVQLKFDNPILMTPPWKEIFTEDTERKHTFEAAVSEYDRLKFFYPSQGYTVVDIPKISVDRRVEFILSLIKINSSA